MLLMTSIGWDADIVANVATSRRDQVSNWDYVRAAMLRLQNWQPPLLTVTVDDELLVDRQRGWIVVSNASEYGGRVNPAPMACMDDRLLDVTFFRASSTLELMSWMLRCRFARQISAPGFVHRRAASSVCISSAVPVRWQLDGDPPPSSSSTRTEHLSISLSDLRLPVLVPQGSRSTSVVGSAGPRGVVGLHRGFSAHQDRSQTRMGSHFACRDSCFIILHAL